ncbi:hypothetical protein SAMN05216374_4239 [Tardiphaga sp. OK246]|uniref:hypothetical protein n=1 Tax=Tardiphaga sp. OK246 TaxID=1855307 RepID=UPI000B6CDFE7|nr:hypothetical protein [Tardiphaga sp. OK246]SNT49780.1 hypothetical protein SAMN05216374_4239 [Tardiphaga sp. OK246]
MASFSDSLQATECENREAEQAVQSQTRRLLAADAAPTDSDISGLADRQAVAVATALLLGIIQPFARGGAPDLISLFLPGQKPDLLAYTCGAYLKVFPYTGSFVSDPLEKLRTRSDSKATLALYACGGLVDWNQANTAARAAMVLRRLVPASIAARRRHG